MIVGSTSDNAPIIVACQESAGRILCLIGADGIIEDSYINDDDNHLLANNSWLWLGGIIDSQYTNLPNWLFIFLFYIENPTNWPLIMALSLYSIGGLVIIIFLINKKKKSSN